MSKVVASTRSSGEYAEQVRQHRRGGCERAMRIRRAKKRSESRTRWLEAHRCQLSELGLDRRIESGPNKVAGPHRGQRKGDAGDKDHPEPGETVAQKESECEPCAVRNGWQAAMGAKLTEMPLIGRSTPKLAPPMSSGWPVEAHIPEVVKNRGHF